jgi:uracil-DNA glycosylase family 4
MLQKPQACEACPLHKAPGPCPPQGDYQTAKVIYVIDQPSSGDAFTGTLLSDGVGNVVTRQCMEAGFPRRDLLVTSVIKCYCAPNEGPNVFREAKKHCARFITKELERAKADTVILAGQGAFDTFIGNYSSLLPNYRPTNNINARMGCVEQRFDKKWIGTIHPKDYMRSVKVRDEVIEHLRKAHRLSGAALPLPKVHKDPPVEELVKCAKLVKNEIKAFADDVETHQMSDVQEDDYVGGDYAVDLCGVSLGPWQAAVFSPEYIELFAECYEDPTVWRYEHNGMYDQYHIAKIIGHHRLYRDFNIWPHNPWMDGMLAAHYHKSYKYKYLKPDCLSPYTDLPYYDRSIEKVDRKFYNGLDVIATHQECITLRRLLAELGCWDLFLRIGMGILPVLEEERQLGVRVDLRKVLLFRHVISAKLEKSKELLLQIGQGLDPTNPHDLKKLMYKVFKLPEQYTKRKVAGGGYKMTLTSDYEARKRCREWLMEQPEEKRPPMWKLAVSMLDLSDYHSGEEKKLEYLNRIDPDGRLHAYYKAHGERPFRLSSTPNLQNWPVYDVSDWGGARKANKGKEADPLGFAKQSLGSLRSIVIPDDDDDLLLTIDFSQVQLWIYAAATNCKALLDIFHSGDYIYGLVYEKLYNEPFFVEGKARDKDGMRDDVPQQRIRRAKAVPLGFLFNRTGEAVALEYGWDMQEGRDLKHWWFKDKPELVRKYEEIEFQMKQKGYLIQPYGNVMWFPEKKVNEAINSLAQTSEAFIVMESKILINEEFKRRGWKNTRPMLSVHDSITFNIAGAKKNPEHLVDVYENIVAPILNRPNPHFGGFRFRHNAEVSYMWDWETQKYSKWKEKTLGQLGRPDQSSVAPA